MKDVSAGLYDEKQVIN